MHVKLVGIDCALNDGLTKTIAGGDEHHILEAGFGVDGKHNARRPNVRAHHALHAR